MTKNKKNENEERDSERAGGRCLGRGGGRALKENQAVLCAGTYP